MSKGDYSRFTTSTRKSKFPKPVHVIVLGGTAGKKTKSLGPKSTIKINDNETILDFQMKKLAKYYENIDWILTIGFDAECVIKNKPANVRLVENTNIEHTNQAEELRLAINNCIYDDIIVIPADTIFADNFLSEFAKNPSSLLLTKGKPNDNDMVGATVVNNDVTILSYGLPSKWQDILYLTGKELQLTKEIFSSKDNSKKHIYEILNDILDRGGKFNSVYTNQESILQLNSIKKIYELRNHANPNITRW